MYAWAPITRAPRVKIKVHAWTHQGTGTHVLLRALLRSLRSMCVRRHRILCAAAPCAYFEPQKPADRNSRQPISMGLGRRARQRTIRMAAPLANGGAGSRRALSMACAHSFRTRPCGPRTGKRRRCFPADHHATGMGKEKTRTTRAFVVGKKVIALPSIGRGGRSS